MWNDYQWMNKPEKIHEQDDALIFHTKGDTDFWRNTHYQFNRMTGHALLKNIPSEEFRCTGSFRVKPEHTFDQAGILIFVDEDNWIKCSVEYIPEGPSHLGGVVTSYAYSDWSTQDFPNARISEEMTFEIIYQANDVEIYFIDQQGKREQIRIGRLHNPNGVKEIKIGPYACSPNELDQGFEVEVTKWKIE